MESLPCRLSNKGNSFDQLTAIIHDNGGRVVDLDDPKLTHVIVDKRDDSRRVELIQRTSKSVVFPLPCFDH